MRISTLQLNSTMQFNMNATSSSLNRLQVQISSGKRLLSPSDDVLATNQLQGLKENIARLGHYKKNIDSSKNELSLAETAMKDMGNVMNRVRSLVLATGSAAQKRHQSANLQEIKLLVGNLKDLANTKSGGEHIFAGTRGDTSPVTETKSAFTTGGSDDVRHVEISSSQKVKLGVTVKQLFSLDTETAGPDKDISDFNDKPDTSNIFNALQEFVTKAGDEKLSGKDFQKILGTTIKAIDQSQGHMNRALTEIGASMKTLELAEGSNKNMATFNQALASSLEDLDIAKATTDFAMKRLQLEAGQKAYARVSTLSLFNLI